MSNFTMKLVRILLLCLLSIHAYGFLRSTSFRRVYSRTRASDSDTIEISNVDFRVGFMFPDIGGDYGRMADRLCKESSGSKELFNRASSILGYDLLQKCINPPESSVNANLVAQPAIFVTTMAALEFLKESDPDTYNSCTFTMGLSLGELSALCFAGCFSFEDGVKLAKTRGQAIQFAADKSNTGMAVVTSKINAAVEQLCIFAYKKSKEPVFVSMYLEDEEFVLSGTNKALIAAAEVAVQYEANIKFLPHCPVGLHSPFGAAASAVMFDALKSVNIRPPRIPVIMNADLTAHYDPAKIRMNIAEALSHPVHWSYAVKQMMNSPNHKESLEIGPGTGLCARIIKEQRNRSKITNFPSV